MALTAKGQPLNARQQHIANLLLSVGKQVGAPTVAIVACIFDGIFESDLGLDNGWNSSNPTYGGPLGGNILYFGRFGSADSDAVATAMATEFYKGGQGFNAGGAIAVASRSSDPKYIGSQVTAAIPFDGNGYSTQYESQNVPGGLSGVQSEAQAIVAAGGGGGLAGGVAGLGGSGTVPNKSAAASYQFTIGSTDNPDEDIWTGINRLAQEVNWYLFSNGEMLYYLDGEEMIAQKPALQLDRVADGARLASIHGTYDNTAFGYVSTHKRKFRLQRKTKVQAVTSPTQVTFDLVCGIDEIRAGDVIELSSFGPMDGRWIVGNCTRSVFEVRSHLTLVPPIAPISELAAAGTTGVKQTKAAATPSSVPGGLSGTLRDKVVQAAKAAIARQASSHAFQYQEIRPYPASLFGPAPIVTDCSGFSILCYKAAGAPDPNGTGYNGEGFTGSLVQRGTSVGTPQPGDLIFYNTVGTNSHVAVYLGNGQIANMGSPGEPVQEGMSIAPIYAIRSYL